jgi:hypothetical protein
VGLGCPEVEKKIYFGSENGEEKLRKVGKDHVAPLFLSPSIAILLVFLSGDRAANCAAGAGRVQSDEILDSAGTSSRGRAQTRTRVAVQPRRLGRGGGLFGFNGFAF